MIPPPIPVAELCPFQKLKLEGSPIPSTLLFLSREGRVPASSTLHPAGFQFSSPCWDCWTSKLPAPKQFTDSNVKGGRQGVPKNFRGLACGSRGQAHSCEKISSFLKINILTNIFGESPVSRPLCVISEGIAHFCAHCHLCLHQLWPSRLLLGLLLELLGDKNYADLISRNRACQVAAWNRPSENV